MMQAAVMVSVVALVNTLGCDPGEHRFKPGQTSTAVLSRLYSAARLYTAACTQPPGCTQPPVLSRWLCSSTG